MSPAYPLTAIYYLADTDAPAPLALFLHGIPGAEKNHDLAHALRHQGWHCLVLHFGGAWGSGGAYDVRLHPAQARSALDFALSPAAPRPIDPRTIALVGFSMGSRAALLAAVEDERVGAVVSLGGFCDFAEVYLEASFFAPFAPFLRDASPQGLAQQFADLAQGLQPLEALAQIAPRPVLVGHGTADEVVPFFHAEALLGANRGHVQTLFLAGANHVFANQREALVRGVSDFLQNWRTSHKS
jgi:fermentation-respiration switch protein FrsA (DUF1100 family)